MLNSNVDFCTQYVTIFIMAYSKYRQLFTMCKPNTSSSQQRSQNPRLDKTDDQFDEHLKH